MSNTEQMQLQATRSERIARQMNFRRGLRFGTGAWVVVLVVLGCSGSADWTTTDSTGGSGTSATPTAGSGAGSGSTACNTCATAADCGPAMRCMGFDFPEWAEAGFPESWALRCAYTTKSTNCCRYSGNSSQCVMHTIYSNGDPKPGSTGGATGQNVATDTGGATSNGGTTSTGT
jgi:hypothetical protein